MKNQMLNSVKSGAFVVALALGVIRFCTAAEGVHVRELGGYVGERMRACYETAVKGEDIPTIVGIFKVRDATWDWKSEFWGKWMHSAPVLAAYYDDADFKAKVAAATKELIATQTPDGYIGNYSEKHQYSRATCVLTTATPGTPTRATRSGCARPLTRRSDFFGMAKG